MYHNIVFASKCTWLVSVVTRVAYVVWEVSCHLCFLYLFNCRFLVALFYPFRWSAERALSFGRCETDMFRIWCARHARDGLLRSIFHRLSALLKQPTKWAGSWNNSRFCLANTSYDDFPTQLLPPMLLSWFPSHQQSSRCPVRRFITKIILANLHSKFV